MYPAFAGLTNLFLIFQYGRHLITIKKSGEMKLCLLVASKKIFGYL